MIDISYKTIDSILIDLKKYLHGHSFNKNELIAELNKIETMVSGFTISTIQKYEKKYNKKYNN